VFCELVKQNHFKYSIENEIKSINKIMTGATRTNAFSRSLRSSFSSFFFCFLLSSLSSFSSSLTSLLSALFSFSLLSTFFSFLSLSFLFYIRSSLSLFPFFFSLRVLSFFVLSAAFSVSYIDNRSSSWARIMVLFTHMNVFLFVFFLFLLLLQAHPCVSLISCLFSSHIHFYISHRKLSHCCI